MQRSLRMLGVLGLLALLAALRPAPLARARFGVELRFLPYHRSRDSTRLLGYPLSHLHAVEGFPAQYFDKARIEDHRGAVDDPLWGMMLGRLTAELIACAPATPLSGTGITYGEPGEAGRPDARVAPPPGFRGGVQEGDQPSFGRSMFIPVDPTLRPAPGYYVPWVFWSAMNRSDLAPDGWLHDVGLPLSPPLWTSASRPGGVRRIMLQAFERTVLTYDDLNPPGWQVERGNLGRDALDSSCVAPPAPPGIGDPEFGANVTIPLRIDARLGTPGQTLVARLRWADGTELAQRLPVIRGEDGGGLLSGNLDWLLMMVPPDPPTQPAILEISDLDGTLLARSGVTVLGPGDPAARTVWLYWTIHEPAIVTPQLRRVVLDAGRPRPGHYWALSEDERLAAATLNALLAGPPRVSQVGFATAIPTPEEVVNDPRWAPGWGHDVALRFLTIRDGVATADFSPGMHAYGGDPQRARLIREQITATLLQFPAIREVRIVIDGQVDGVLTP